MEMQNHILKYWNEAPVKFSPELLSNCQLPLETKNFLQTVGVPPWYGAKDYPYAIFRANHIRKYTYQNDVYIVLGEGVNEIKVSLREPSGEVFIITSEKQPPQFINTTIQCFVAFLILFKELPSQADDDTDKLIFYKLRQQLINKDTNALSEKGNWWSLILEDIENSL